MLKINYYMDNEDSNIFEKVGISKVFAMGVIFFLVFLAGIIYFIRPPAETPSENVLAIGEFSKVQGEIKVPIFKLISLSNLSRDEILKKRENFVNQTPDLIKNPYHPTGAVFANMQSGLPWFNLYGFFYRGKSSNSVKGPSVESRTIANPFLLVAPEFWGLSKWYKKGVKWDKKKLSKKLFNSPSFPYYPIPNDLTWNPSKSRAETTLLLSDFIESLNQYAIKPLPKKNISFGLSAYNARDFGFGFMAVDSSLSTNIKDYDASDTPFPITDRIVALNHMCTDDGPCNHMDVPMLEANKIIIDKLPATIYVKLWYQTPASAADAPNMYFILNFL
jgi:hypothetical protein